MELVKYCKKLIICIATSYYWIQFYATNVMESTSGTDCSFYAYSWGEKDMHCAYNKSQIKQVAAVRMHS